MDGCYAMLKNEYEYIEYASSNSYVRHYMQMAEFPGDNTSLSGRTTDPLYQATVYQMTDNLKNVGLFWWIGYKVIYTANVVIDHYDQKGKEGESAEGDQLLGEAYFLRAMCHFQLATIFAKPYSYGRDNMGIIIRTTPGTDKRPRASVGEVYDQIVLDLQKAASLMTSRKDKDNHGYACKNTALGLLSRVYLYMEENDKVIETINQMGDPVANLDPKYADYFANAVGSKETLLAIAHTSLENRGSASIGSMYNGDGGGWGEVYCSDPLLNLYERYPEDIRLSYIKPQYAATNADMVYFAVPDSIGSSFDMWGEVKSDATGKYCELEGKKYYIKEAKIKGNGEEDASGEYTTYYVEYAGMKCSARFTKAMIMRNTFPNYWITKFSYQDGQPQLSSPVFLRWGEVLLNRAEAYAKLGQDDKALDDVNAIRARAGIPAAGMFAVGNLHGYDNVLDVVLDERRMELAFEGHRMFDVYRNKRDMDRRFGGCQPWEIVDHNDNKIQYPIPYDEHSVNNLVIQNPGY